MALPPHTGRERGHFTGFRGVGITRTLKVHDPHVRQPVKGYGRLLTMF